MPEKAQITVKEAAALIGISERGVRWACKHSPKVLGAQKVGRDWSLSRRMVERYAAARRTPRPARQDTDEIKRW